MHNGADEIRYVNISMRILMARKQLINLLVRETFAQRRKKMTEFGHIDEAIAFLVEVRETFDELLDRMTFSLLVHLAKLTWC